MNNPHDAWDMAMEAFTKANASLLIGVMESVESAAKRGRFSCLVQIPDTQTLEGLNQYLIERNYGMEPEPNNQVRINWRGRSR